MIVHIKFLELGTRSIMSGRNALFTSGNPGRAQISVHTTDWPGQYPTLVVVLIYKQQVGEKTDPGQFSLLFRIRCMSCLRHGSGNRNMAYFFSDANV